MTETTTLNLVRAESVYAANHELHEHAWDDIDDLVAALRDYASGYEEDYDWGALRTQGVESVYLEGERPRRERFHLTAPIDEVLAAHDRSQRTADVADRVRLSSALAEYREAADAEQVEEVEAALAELGAEVAEFEAWTVEADGRPLTAEVREALAELDRDFAEELFDRWKEALAADEFEAPDLTQVHVDWCPGAPRAAVRTIEEFEAGQA
ncbi:hypothetical protein LG274_02580 [Micrococcus antarcticus]|uniref:hypothetical protein n=1 Tax=Micrococcus antarcticus TaxID=86171 RepID=UPI00384BD109